MRPGTGLIMTDVIRYGKSAPKDCRTRNWQILIYEDSCPNWREVIQTLKVPAIVSPLHDKDIRSDGTPKKPHRHCIFKFSGKKSLVQIQHISDMFSGVNVLWEQCAVGDMRGAVRYLVHFDDADKAQYSMNDIECFFGIDYMEYFEQASDVDACVGEMMRWLDEDTLASFARLSRYARDNRPDWFRVLSSKRTVFINAYAKAVSWERKVSGIGEAVKASCVICRRTDVEMHERQNIRGEVVNVCIECMPTYNTLFDENLKFVYGEDI